MLRKIRYGVEAFFMLLAMVFFRILPLDVASATGGALARLIGPLAGAHRTARKNLERAMPELGEAERAKILSDMWDNLGRTIGEYPHLNRPIMRKRIMLEGREHLERVKRLGKGVIFVSGHFANWEICPLTASLYDTPLTAIYRAANNPVAEWLIQKIRSGYTSNMAVKGRAGAAEAIKALKQHQVLAMLIDQKQNDGIPVPFFGIPAMTPAAVVQLAVKYAVPVMPVHVVRTNGAHFHTILDPEFYYSKETDPLEAMTVINAMFERWIRENPGQWLWVHRRWG